MTTCEALGENFCGNGGLCVEDPENTVLVCDCSQSSYFASTEFLFLTQETSEAPEITSCNTHRQSYITVHAVALASTLITVLLYMRRANKISQHRRLAAFYLCGFSFFGYCIAKLVAPEDQFVGEHIAPTIFFALSTFFANFMFHMFLFKYLKYGSNTICIKPKSFSRSIKRINLTVTINTVLGTVAAALFLATLGKYKPLRVMNNLVDARRVIFQLAFALRGCNCLCFFVCILYSFRMIQKDTGNVFANDVKKGKIILKDLHMQMWCGASLCFVHGIFFFLGAASARTMQYFKYFAPVIIISVSIASLCILGYNIRLRNATYTKCTVSKNFFLEANVSAVMVQQ